MSFAYEYDSGADCWFQRNKKVKILLFPIFDENTNLPAQWL